jgi:hypothetical protein
MEPIQRLSILVKLSHFQLQNLSINEIIQIRNDLIDSNVDFLIIDIERILCVLYNLIQNIDKNILFGDEFVDMIRKIISHFLNRDISREVALLFESIFKSLSPENCDVLADDALVHFIIKFMKWKKGGAIYIRKYYLIVMRISVVCPTLIPTFLEHMDIPQVKKLVGNDGNDSNTMFSIYNWIYHISSQPCGIDFIMKEPEYFTKILCELVKNTILQIFFQKAIMTLENILRLENQVIQEMARSEITGCIPNMMKVYFPQDLREKWEGVQKMF